jgi:hypothetical protein
MNIYAVLNNKNFTQNSMSIVHEVQKLWNHLHKNQLIDDGSPRISRALAQFL